MTKEELKKEAENWLRKYLLCCNCEKKCNCIDSNSYCEEQVLQAYVDSAEPREKRIADIEETNNKLCEQLGLRYNLEDKIKVLEAQIEKMKSVVISERDEALRVEDVITYGVLNDVLDKWEAEEK